MLQHKKSVVDLNETFIEDINYFKEGYHNLKDSKNDPTTIVYLRDKLHQYDLIMRELQEIDVKSLTNFNVFSINLYSEYMEFNKLVHSDFKVNLHSYISEFLNQVNKNLAQLNAKIIAIKNNRINSETDFKMMILLHKEFKAYRDDIEYLRRDDFQLELPVKFMELDAYLFKTNTLLGDLEIRLEQCFVSHFTKWKETFIQQKDKITELGGVWEKIVKLNKMFQDSYEHLKKVEKDCGNFNVNIKNVNNLVQSVRDVIKTIEYKGVNAINVADSNNSHMITHYMADDMYAAMRSKQVIKTVAIDIVVGVPISVYTGTKVGAKVAKLLIKNGKVVRWLATGVSSTLVGGIAGAVVSILVDIVFGDLLDALINTEWISHGAGISYTINKNFEWLGIYKAIAMKNTLKAQAMKYLDKF